MEGEFDAVYEKGALQRSKSRRICPAKMDAVYENGALKLAEPLPLPEQTKVTVTIITHNDAPLEKNGKSQGAQEAILNKRETFDHRKYAFVTMNWTSTEMRTYYDKMVKAADTDYPVLIMGENGTEKEESAFWIHQRSTRNKGSFLKVACGAIPLGEHDIELFGAEQSSSRGEHLQRKGSLEKAAAGTLFMEEVDKLPPEPQYKLQEFLKGKMIFRVGGRTQVLLDTRIIAATVRDLAIARKNNEFREDFYYSLSVVTLRIPALRERGTDIASFATALVHRFGAENGHHNAALTEAALQAILQYSWPGNVRELENKIKRAVIMANSPQIGVDDLSLPVMVSTNKGPRTLKELRQKNEIEVITAALNRHNYKILPAALELGISRPTLYELIEKYGLRDHQ